MMSNFRNKILTDSSRFAPQAGQVGAVIAIQMRVL